jgi:hypothetical protein
MYAHIQKPPDPPVFELETTDHPLSREYHHGIAPERVKEIRFPKLADSRCADGPIAFPPLSLYH